VSYVHYITLLGIESSCDDTSAAVLQNGKMLSNVVATQDVHIKYGGVVPELASRSHQKNIVPVIDQAIQQADIKLSDLDGIVFTQGPGLLGSLLVGSSFAKGLSLALNKPLVAVNHLEAHVLSPLIENPHLELPYLCLLVSGGHTQIMLVNSASDIRILGKTIDDAAGEAFDKVAKILGLPYPGGPLIDKHAQHGNTKAFHYNIGKAPGLDFSFSGFKTSVLYSVRDALQKDATFIDGNLSHICASAQFTIVNYLIKKLMNAVEQTGIKTVTIAGGVAANSFLRSELQTKAKNLGWHLMIPSFEYCTDNAGMIVNAGYHKYLSSNFANLESKAYASGVS